MNLSTLKQVTLLIIGLAASNSWAHTLFAKPVIDDAGDTSQDALTVNLINGSYWIAESPVRRDRLASLQGVTPAGTEFDVADDDWRTQQKLGVFDVALSEPGTYVLGAATRPNSVRMTGEAFTRYLTAEGSPSVSSSMSPISGHRNATESTRRPSTSLEAPLPRATGSHWVIWSRLCR